MHQRFTVAVAQLVESRIVIPVVVGSSPISHPIPPNDLRYFLELPLLALCPKPDHQPGYPQAADSRRTAIAVCASLFAIGTPSFAAQGDATLQGAVAELRAVPPDRGEWTNRYMSHRTGRHAAASADEILTATLRIYTRQVLDRGGWVNAFVSSPGYDAGHPLLAVNVGEGVTTVASPSRLQVPQVVALATR